MALGPRLSPGLHVVGAAWPPGDRGDALGQRPQPAADRSRGPHGLRPCPGDQLHGTKGPVAARKGLEEGHYS